MALHCPHRHRHLMLDLGQLLPTAKRDAKLDTKSDRAVINEAAELKVALSLNSAAALLLHHCSTKRACPLLSISRAEASTATCTSSCVAALSGTAVSEDILGCALLAVGF